MFACSTACASKLQQGYQPAGSAHFKVHNNRNDQPLLLSPAVAANEAAAAWLHTWLQRQGLCSE